jgi:hypothetical protein
MTTLLSALRELRTAFPGKDIPPETVALYARQLSDLPEADVVDAVYRIMRTSRFFPSLGEIREAAVAGGPVDGIAETAWTEVLREVARVGWNRGPIWQGGVRHEPEQPRFANPITEAAVKSLSWKMICQGEAAEVRSQFLWTWKNIASGTVKRQAGRQSVDALLPGRSVAAIQDGGGE